MLNEVEFTRKLFASLLEVIPKIYSCVIVMVCVLLIYSVVGMELFSFLKYGQELNEFDQNYTDFFSSMYSLVKFSLLENPIYQIEDAGSTFRPDFICN